MHETNLRRIGGRSRPVVGDVFRLEVGTVPLLGRVVSTTARALVDPTANLIYVFQASVTADEHVDPAALTVDHLLIAPVMTNNKPWSLGFFTPVANLPFGPHQVLGRHCFRSWDGRLYDEHGQAMDRPVEPVGEWGLASYRVIDDKLSSALGLRVAPD